MTYDMYDVYTRARQRGKNYSVAQNYAAMLISVTDATTWPERFDDFVILHTRRMALLKRYAAATDRVHSESTWLDEVTEIHKEEY